MAAECCDDKGSCKDFSCPATTQPKPGKDGIRCKNAACVVGECCDDRGSCADYTCPTDKFVPKPLKDSLTCEAATCTPEDCCTAKGSCKAYSCPAATAPKPDKDDIQCAAE